MDNQQPSDSVPLNTTVQNAVISPQEANRYYYLFEQSNDAVFLLDLRGNHIACNQRAAQLFGYPYQDLVSMSFRDLSFDVESSADIFQQLLLGYHVPIYERVFRHRDGHDIICEVNVQVVYDLNSKPIYFQSLLRDVTERKKLEEQLRASEERYRSVVTALSEGIIMQDASGRIITSNKMAEQILGLTDDQLYGRTSYDPRWCAVHEDGTPFEGDDHPAIVTLKSGQPQTNVVMGIRRADDTQVWISINSQPLFKPDETKPYAVVTSFTDITEQRESHFHALKAALERERVTMLTQFIENAAHEFRTPLSIINSSTYLLARAIQPEKQKHYQRMVESQVARITRLVDMLLQMTLLNTQNDFPLITIATEEFLDDVVRRTQTSRVVITCDIREPLPPLHINEDMIHQALRELIENAKRHTPDGGRITVNAQIRDAFIVISVQDNGEGIEEEYLTRIFETFWRADDAHSTPGLGLGLSIAQRIVEKHGGHIAVESVPGQGSTFTVWLPYVTPATR